MKKIVSLVICAVLTVAAMLCLYQPADCFAGSGSGTDRTVSNTEELSHVIKDVCRVFNSGNIMPLTSIEDEDEHTSVTVISSFSSTSKVTASGVTVITEMECDMRYCISADGQVLISASVDTNTGSQRISVDFTIYTNGTVSALKYNSLHVSGIPSGNTSIIIGKWIDYDDVASSMGLDIGALFAADKANLLLIDEYLSEHNADCFEESDGKLVMQEDIAREFATEVLMTNVAALGSTVTDIDVDDLGFTLDLSNEAEPNIDYNLTKGTYSFIANNGTTKCEVTTEQSMRFVNIDNTVVDFNAERIYNISDLIGW